LLRFARNDDVEVVAHAFAVPSPVLAKTALIEPSCSTPYHQRSLPHISRHGFGKSCPRRQDLPMPKYP
jgi:hypothetical protein